MAPTDGLGHYAGNVSQVLGVDGAPLQVHGVTDFNIDFGTLVPGVPYAARLTVLGAEITSGGTPMPVTLLTETNTEVFEPFGPFDDPNLGNVNDANNPRHFVYSLDDIYSAGTPISVTGKSWLPQGGGGGGDVGWQGFSNYTTSDTRDKQRAFQVTMPENGTVTSITAWALRYAGVGAVRYAIYSDIAGEPGNLIAQTPIGSAPLSWGWVTLPLPPTPITAGTYWLAYTCDNDARFKHISDVSNPTPATTQWRGLTYSALTNGFIWSWGASSIGFIRTNQIYFSYTTGGTFSPHISAIDP